MNVVITSPSPAPGTKEPHPAEDPALSTQPPARQPHGPQSHPVDALDQLLDVEEVLQTLLHLSDTSRITHQDDLMGLGLDQLGFAQGHLYGLQGAAEKV